jgi:hypothetical protein
VTDKAILTGDDPRPPALRGEPKTASGPEAANQQVGDAAGRLIENGQWAPKTASRRENGKQQVERRLGGRTENGQWADPVPEWPTGEEILVAAAAASLEAERFDAEAWRRAGEAADLYLSRHHETSRAELVLLLGSLAVLLAVFAFAVARSLGVL